MAVLLPNSVFIHIPKTAGQWVASALEHMGLATGHLGVVHASPDEIRSEPAFQQRPVVFTMVRHPLLWYPSMWAHRMDENWSPVDDPDWFTPRWVDTWASFTESCRSDTFDDFVHKCTARFPSGYVSMLYDAYTRDCTFVGRQENLAQDLVKALELSGETFDPADVHKVPPRNVRGRTPARKKQSRYTPELIDCVMRAEAWAVEKFGYEEIPDSIIVDGSSRSRQ